MDKILITGIDEIPHLGRSFRIAAEELGMQVALYDDRAAFGKMDSSLLGRARIKARGMKPSSYKEYNNGLIQLAKELRPDTILVIKGTYIHHDALVKIKEKTGAFIVNYSTDNPFNKKVSSREIVKSIPHYNLYFTTRKSTIDDLRKCGAMNVRYIRFGYDPTIHYPDEALNEEERKRYTCDVSFIGGCDNDRERILKRLVKDVGRSFHFYGGYYNDKLLRPYWRGFAYDREYRLALRYSRISLCFVRAANEDDHVMRTFEIPACKGFPLVEATSTHYEIFRGEASAILFDSYQELVEKIAMYVQDQRKTNDLRDYIHLQIISDNNTYKDRLIEMISEICK